MPAVNAYLSGLLFCLSLIVAIGAQNAYLLRQGARRDHVGAVIAVCSCSDALLIATGVAGVGAVVSTDHGLLIALRGLGAVLLLGYAALATRRAMSRPIAGTGAASGGGSLGTVITASLGFTWLNPAAYLDSVVLIGSVAGTHPATRWWFGAGAISASVAWFVALGMTARLLGPLLHRPGAARALEAFVALTMTVTALRTLPV